VIQLASGFVSVTPGSGVRSVHVVFAARFALEPAMDACHVKLAVPPLGRIPPVKFLNSIPFVDCAMSWNSEMVKGPALVASVRTIVPCVGMPSAFCRVLP
jgi:hypothetical protein